MVRRPYPPGAHGKRARRGGASEFGAELHEKQKVRFLYGISDRVLKGYVAQAARAAHKTKTQALTELLERRLDSVVFRLGLAQSRRIAQHLVSYGHILVNGKSVKTRSILLKAGDRVSVRETSRSLPPFEGLTNRLKKYQTPEWLEVRPDESMGSLMRLPNENDQVISQNLSKVIEYYSR